MNTKTSTQQFTAATETEESMDRLAATPSRTTSRWRIGLCALLAGLGLWVAAPSAFAYDISSKTCTVERVVVSSKFDYLYVLCAETMSSDSSLGGSYKKKPWFESENTEDGRSKFTAYQQLATAALLSGKKLLVTADVEGSSPRLVIKNLALVK